MKEKEMSQGWKIAAAVAVFGVLVALVMESGSIFPYTHDRNADNPFAKPPTAEEITAMRIPLRPCKCGGQGGNHVRVLHCRLEPRPWAVNCPACGAYGPAATTPAKAAAAWNK